MTTFVRKASSFPTIIAPNISPSQNFKNILENFTIKILISFLNVNLKKIPPRFLFMRWRKKEKKKYFFLTESFRLLELKHVAERRNNNLF